MSAPSPPRPLTDTREFEAEIDVQIIVDYVIYSTHHHLPHRISHLHERAVSQEVCKRFVHINFRLMLLLILGEIIVVGRGGHD